jgi:maleate isomerase
MEKSGVPFITTSTAVIEALKALKMDRISVATPYSNKVDKKEREFLEENGIKVLKIRGLGLIKNSEIGKQPLRRLQTGKERLCEGRR